MLTGFSRGFTRRPGLGRLSRRAATCVVVVAGLSAAELLAGAPVRAAGSAATSASVQAGTSTLPLQVVGTVNLAQLGAPAPQVSTGVTQGGLSSPHRATPLGLIDHPAAVHHGSNSPQRTTPLGGAHNGRGRYSGSAATAAPARLPRATLDGLSQAVAGSSGFDGIDAQVEASVNSPYLGGVGIVSPPDQGLGVGPSPSGTAVVEFVNDALEIYSTSGTALIGALPAFQVFDQPPATFLSDPRVYWDPVSHHWFLTMFAFAGPGGTVGQYGCNNGGAVVNGCLSAQFIAVSVTTNPLGSYEVFWFDTSDGTSAGSGGHIGDGCPCFGDYDMVGSDNSGLYITTNEFCMNSSTACSNSITGTFNGTIIYAVSKSELIAAAAGGSVPTIVRYGVSYLNASDTGYNDPYAAYHLSPSTVTQGSLAPKTEYFVESNANLPNNATTTGLEVFALLDTSALKNGGIPPLVMTTVATEQYTELPPDAVQKSGPIPLGNLLGVTTTPSLATDFNAVQEVTYSSGLLYAELDTGLALGQEEISGAAWFVLRPQPTTSSLSATTAANGYVETTQDILYPDIAVNQYGQGYMAFSIAGPAMYPSAAYVSFNGTQGAGSSVQVAALGADPLDDFTCYAPYGPPCRYGDYSMAQEYNGTTFMATEYVPALPRITYSNWGTRIYTG